MTRSCVQNAHWIAAKCCTNAPYDSSAHSLCQHTRGSLPGKRSDKLPKNRWSFDSHDKRLGSVPKALGRSLRCDHQSRRPRFDECGGKLPSTASVYWLFGIQMTTFHPLPVHHQLGLAIMSHLMLGWIGLFFKPSCQGMAADTKDAFNTAHAGTLVIGSQDLFFLRCGVSSAWIEHTALVAILTPKLLAATGVMTILDDIWTATPSTYMYDCFGYHIYTISSLQLDHYRKFHTIEHSPEKLTVLRLSLNSKNKRLGTWQ